MESLHEINQNHSMSTNPGDHWQVHAPPQGTRNETPMSGKPISVVAVFRTDLEIAEGCRSAIDVE
jgi:hypothetical protein